MSVPFDPDIFEKNLKTDWIGRNFIYQKQLDSTNLFLKKVPSEDLRPGTVLLADYQTHGRGQYEKEWISNRYENLTFTIAVRPTISSKYSLLTLCCALAIADVFEEYTSEKVNLKWPNDLLVSGKKIGGILTEAIFLGNKPDRVLIGAGLNIHQQEFGETAGSDIISLCQITDHHISREKLLCECLKKIEHSYDLWENSDNNQLIQISKRLIGYGEWVNLSVYNKLLPEKYKFIGVSNKGELLMLDEQLDVHKFSYEQVRIFPVKQRVPSH